MPELPEVETIVRELEDVLVGQVFESLEVFWVRSVDSGGFDFDDLRNLKVLKVFRRGKFINILMEEDWIITVHLRMSGRLIVKDRLMRDELRFERVCLKFDKSFVHFCDQRKFGRIWLNKVVDYQEKTGIYKLGVEPLCEEFSWNLFQELFTGRRGSLKRFLLDQTVIAGIGNIYADEACFYAGIRPDSNIENLDGCEKKKLFDSIKKALEQGIKNKGTSISDFVGAYGSKGRNQELLYVYGRGGEDCLKCKKVLEKIKHAGRTTVYCKKCQSLGSGV